MQLQTRVMSAAQIEFPDNTFDVVYAANVLHHADTDKAIAEIHRVLKPGGVAATWDPLRYNPLIAVYRRIADAVRTENERPVGREYLRKVQRRFREVEYDTFWLATLWIFVRFYLIERVHPAADRYWKKIYTDEPRLRSSYCRLEKIDRLLKKIPFVKWLAWNLVVVAHK
jgi:ubiquinone/menaquinone biosynthesis C-methylase UbiE